MNSGPVGLDPEAGSEFGVLVEHLADRRLHPSRIRAHRCIAGSVPDERLVEEGGRASRGKSNAELPIFRRAQRHVEAADLQSQTPLDEEPLRSSREVVEADDVAQETVDRWTSSMSDDGEIVIDVHTPGTRPAATRSLQQLELARETVGGREVVVIDPRDVSAGGGQKAGIPGSRESLRWVVSNDDQSLVVAMSFEHLGRLIGGPLVDDDHFDDCLGLLTQHLPEEALEQPGPVPGRDDDGDRGLDRLVVTHRASSLISPRASGAHQPRRVAGVPT